MLERGAECTSCSGQVCRGGAGGLLEQLVPFEEGRRDRGKWREAHKDGVCPVPFRGLWSVCLWGLYQGLLELGLGTPHWELGTCLFVLGEDLELGQLVWGGHPRVHGQHTVPPWGRGWPAPPPPPLGCPALAGCPPPISVVGHQGNRATLGSEPGASQPGWGRGRGKPVSRGWGVGGNSAV